MLSTKKETLESIARNLLTINDLETLNTFLNKNKNQLCEILTKVYFADKNQQQSTLFRLLNNPGKLLLIAKVLSMEEGFRVFSAECLKEANYSYEAKYAIINDGIDLDLRQSAFHVLAKSNFKGFKAVLSLFDEVKIKQALTQRDNYGTTVFDIFCSHYQDKVIDLLAPRESKNIETIITTRSFHSIYYQNDLKLDYASNISQYPIAKFLTSKEIMAFFLSHFSEKSWGDFLKNHVSAFSDSLLTLAVPNSELLDMMLAKCAKDSHYFTLRKTTFCALTYLNNYASFKVIEKYLTKQEIKSIVFQGDSIDNPNNHLLFNIISLYAEKKKLNVKKEVKSIFALCNELLNCFETDADKIKLLNKINLHGRTLLFHETVFIYPELFEAILTWLPKEIMFDLLTNNEKYQQLIDVASLWQGQDDLKKYLQAPTLAVFTLKNSILLTLMLNEIPENQKIDLIFHIIDNATIDNDEIDISAFNTIKIFLSQHYQSSPKEKSTSIWCQLFGNNTKDTKNNGNNISYQINKASTIEELRFIKNKKHQPKPKPQKIRNDKTASI